MFVSCFICKIKFQDLNIYFSHLKLIHLLSSTALYKCGIANCSQNFTNFRAFSKHIKLQYLNAQEVDLKLQESCLSNNLNIPFSNSTNNINNFPQSKKNDLHFVDLQSLVQSSLKFSLFYYAKPNFSRKDAVDLQLNISQIITSCIANQIEKLILNTNDNKIKESLKVINDFCKDPFKEINSEYKMLNYLQSINVYRKPNIITLDNQVQNIVLNNSNTIDNHKIKGIIFPLKFQLKKYFELPGILDAFLDYSYTCSISTKYTNFINGEHWKLKKIQFNEKLVIPFFLYFDDFEINNALGSHSSSLLGVYYSFPTAPHYLRSNLKHIFIAAIFNTKDIKQIGNDRAFFKLIEEINNLQRNGVLLEFPSKTIQIFFQLGLIVGDNLGVNTTLGFSKSFSASHFCRFCQNDKKKTQIHKNEVNEYLRNKRNYDEDVAKKDSKLTGIYEESIFNTVNLFHVVENFSVDIMHDIYEGVGNYNMCHIILKLIDLKYFNLETLNNRKQHFNYGTSEIGNLSGPIKMLNSKKLSIKMSAREMQTFIHFFPLIIGDMVPENNEVWLFLLNFVEITDLILLPGFDDKDIIKLNKCIAYHNIQYVNLFNDCLKPKHHFLTHYCHIIRQSGPLKYLWTYNFESKHRELKSYTKNINSRMNTPLSIGIKFCLNFSEFITNFNVEDLKNYKPLSKGYSIALCQYYQEIKHLFSNELLLKNALYYDKISFCGTKYKTDNLITTYDNNIPLIFVIKQIICVNNTTIYLFCAHLEIISYKKHFASYKINVSANNDNYVLKNINEFNSPPIHIYTLCSNETVVRLKNYF